MVLVTKAKKGFTVQGILTILLVIDFTAKEDYLSPRKILG
jgi:hypothetical protein